MGERTTFWVIIRSGSLQSSIPDDAPTIRARWTCIVVRLSVRFCVPNREALTTELLKFHRQEQMQRLKKLCDTL